MIKVKKAVIPAAGLGTRVLPATKAQPKEMIPIVDKPTIQYIIEEAVDAGIEDIIIITGKGKNSIEDHFDRSLKLELALEAKGKEQMLQEVKKISNMVQLHYIRQKEAKGLGHAIYCARTFIGDEAFAILLGDDVMVAQEPVIGQMMEIFEEKEDPLIGVKEIPEEEAYKYGVISYKGHKDRLYQVEDLIEKPAQGEAPSNLAIFGRYIVTPDIFPILSSLEPGRNNEIQLTDALKLLLQKREINAYDFKGKRYDLGNKLGFLKATVEFALRRDDLQQEFKDYIIELVESGFLI